MKTFFFRLFLLLFLAALGYALFLAAPFGLFFYSFQILNNSEEALAFELLPLSALIVLEDNSATEATPFSNQTLTYTLPDETLERILFASLEKRPIPGVVLDSLTVLIAPEMLSVEISWQCELLGYRFYENTIFSEWLIRAGKNGDQQRIEIKPRDLHSNHLYSLNLAEYWTYNPRIKDPDGWVVLAPGSAMNIQELVLQDGAIALTFGAVTENGASQ